MESLRMSPGQSWLTSTECFEARGFVSGLVPGSEHHLQPDTAAQHGPEVAVIYANELPSPHRLLADGSLQTGRFPLGKSAWVW